MNIDIEKYLKDKGLFKTVVEDYNPYIVADLMEMYAKKYHEDQLNNLSQHLVSHCAPEDEDTTVYIDLEGYSPSKTIVTISVILVGSFFVLVIMPEIIKLFKSCG